MRGMKRPYLLWTGLIAAYLLMAPVMIGLRECDEARANTYAFGTDFVSIEHFGCCPGPTATPSAMQVHPVAEKAPMLPITRIAGR